MAEQDKNIEGIYPLSPMQQGMLFHTLLSANSAVYFNQRLCTLSGVVEEAALQRAWQEVVQRHDSLRALFVWEGREKPLQVIRRRVALPWHGLDWRGLSPEEQTAKLEAHLQADRRRGFDLGQAPLMRMALIRMEESRYELLWSHHHILTDGWSDYLILKEVLTAYQNISQGRECGLEASRSYRTYVNWLQRQDFSKAEAFWRVALKGFSTPTPLWGNPINGGRAYGDSEVVQQLSRLPPSLVTALGSFAGRRGLTVSTLAHGAWALLLNRYTGEEDVMFGSVVSGRPAELPGIESLVGLFINTLPVRARFSPHDLVAAWLKSFQNQLVELRQYEHSALVDVQGWSEVPRDQPLFESLLAFENYPFDDSVLAQQGGLRISGMRGFEKTNFPLSVAIVPRKELAIRIQYDPRRFDSGAVTRMLGHYQTLLEGIVSNPDQRLSELPLLTSAERHKLLVEWNPDRADILLDGCVHELFEKQAEHQPDAVAVVFENQKLTYRELNQRANQVAHVLRKMGVGPEELVGVYTERSLEMVIAILGIVKAGGAYLPLDPVYPPERLAFMLEDARPKAVLTQQRLRDSLPKEGVAIVSLDAEQERLAGESAANPESGARLDNLAYVIYTSGSTGKPKGTLVTHRNVTRLFGATQEWFDFGPQDVWTLFHSHAFDFSVWEIWGALAHGGRLVVVPYLVSRSPDAFYELLSNEKVTVLNQTPSAFRQLIQAEETAGESLPLALRLVIFGGEALEMQSLKPWFERHGDQSPQLVNMYGITETTVHVTYRPLSRADVDSGSVIGIPIPDLKVYILDRNRQPVPLGIPGELYVGGAGVARGYLNRPELTAEKFMVNPFTTRQGERLYRSGDLARHLPNRDIEYLGRIDDQVKIRGFRIELREIESVLAGLPGVREAVVMAREDVPGDKRLVAYVTANEAELPNPSGLRGLLQAKLPEYMVPSAFVILEKFPLTPNGKVDRKKLPAPDLSRSEVENSFVAPRTSTENVLADIWSQVLRIKRVSVHDNFFDLGGHSLLATRIVSQVRASMQVELPLRTLFDAPTVASLAAFIETLLWVRQSGSEQVALHPLAKGKNSLVEESL